MRRASIPFDAIGPGARAPVTHISAAEERRNHHRRAIMAQLDSMDDPKKPTQLPPETADAVGKHDESDFNDAGDADDDDDSGITEDDPYVDTSDFE
jgi:hypothetical protein